MVKRSIQLSNKIRFGSPFDFREIDQIIFQKTNCEQFFTEAEICSSGTGLLYAPYF
jgi:hypothetical protein